MDNETVRVALRVRPLLKTEIAEGYQTSLDVVPGEPQIQIRNTDKAFTYNYVFPPDTKQEDFYNTAIKGLITNVFRGYNVTVLAYGQTGSGKTHCMGTNYTGNGDLGVIPRAINEIFETAKCKQEYSYKVTVSFIELYQEQLYDLLTEKRRSQATVDMKDDGKGLKMIGLTEVEVQNPMEALNYLSQGSLGRVTGATAMNAQSSRSHAIFTICVSQREKDNPHIATTAKFHLVDLAGSERSKKTQATGERFKEGVNINKGLLALGNVISQLGDGGSVSYIGYRDSKLTRLLQDSLGGNSVTLMIACVSPADYNLDETLCTLRYADRARKIKNKPVVNQDPQVAEIQRLTNIIKELKLSLVGQEIQLNCPPEHQQLQEHNWCLQNKLRDLTDKLNSSLIQIVMLHEKIEQADEDRENIIHSLTTVVKDVVALLHHFEQDDKDKTFYHAKLNDIYKKVVDLQNTMEISQGLSTDDITNNEEMPVAAKTNNTACQITTDEVSTEVVDSLNYFDEKSEEHTLRQTERIDEVQNINRELAIKNELVSRLLKDSCYAGISTFNSDIQELEAEIKSLQTEKEELLQALRDVQTKNVSSKLAESRRKKVQELEKRIAELSKKCLEQNKIIKIKEKSDQKIKILSDEMKSLKETRIKLIRQMRSDANTFSRWKQSREKEINKLKDQNQKRLNEIARLQSKHLKQQNVLKRKMEEYSIVNKRLKAALDIQKKASQRSEMATNSKGGIQAWISQEIEVLLSTVNVECSLEQLMVVRAKISKELEELKSNDVNNTKVVELSEYLDLVNIQIGNFQKQILASDEENRSYTRWNSIQTMVDAKAALKVLFQFIADNQKKLCAKDVMYEELQTRSEILVTLCNQFQDKLQSTHEKLEVLKKRDEERLPSRRLTFNISNEPIESEQEIHKLKNELMEYKKRCEQLEEMLTSAAPKTKTAKSGSANRKNVGRVAEVAEDCEFELDDSLNEDDVQKDPDWQKTPLYNRIQKLRSSTRPTADESSTTTKRSFDGDIKCSCKTTCSTRLCTCRKNSVACSNCNCNAESCQNKDQENLPRTLFLDEDESEEMIKKTKYFE